MEFDPAATSYTKVDKKQKVRSIGVMRVLGIGFYRLTTLFFAITTFAVSLLAYNLYRQQQAAPQSSVTTQTTTENFSQDNAKLAEIKTAFEKVAVVPAGEEPSIGQIVDVEQLRKQNPTFYADAQNGDALFIYKNKAYVFRVSENKVVNVAPVDRTADTKQ